MTKFFKEKGSILFLLLFFISILPFFGRLFQQEKQVTVTNELYTPELSSLNSVDKVVHYTDSLYAVKNIQGFDTAVYVHIVSRTVRERFYHGLSQYTLPENWIAWVSGKLFWSHLSAIVIPNDILKHSEGLCSQQTIVFMEILRRKNINVRSVGLGYKEGPGHFLCEVHYLGSWRLHDVTVEPQWKNNITANHESMDYYVVHKDSLYNVYKNRMEKPLFDKITEKVSLGKVNEFPAKSMFIFQNVTAVFTYVLPLLFLVIGIRLSRAKNKKTKIAPVTPVSQKQRETELVL